MASLVITIKTANSELARLVGSSSSRTESTNALASFLQACATGHEHAAIYTGRSTSNPVAASGTWTLSSVVATDTVTVGKTTFTGTDTPTTSLHFDTSSADDEVIAASIAAAVNAHADASLLVSATSSGAVVTVTALQKGSIGNHIAFSDGDATIASTGSGYLSGGTGGHEVAGAAISQGV